MSLPAAFGRGYSDDMWEINNGLQALSFLYSIIIGGIFSLIYDVLRSVRKCREFSCFEIFIQDILYFVIITPTTFLFLLATNNGEIRAYAIIGIIFGFCLLRFTFSFIFLKVLCFIFTTFFWCIGNISRSVYRFFAYCEGFVCDIWKNMAKFLLFAFNFCKKLLKKQ